MQQVYSSERNGWHKKYITDPSQTHTARKLNSRKNEQLTYNNRITTCEQTVAATTSEITSI